MRLNKFLAQNGLCSRREADTLIANNWVEVDGQPIPAQGVKIEPGQTATLLPAAYAWLDKKVTVILNKPPGYVSNLPEDDKTPAVELVTTENFYGTNKAPWVLRKGLAPAGRLDIDSSGLLILTQDGALAKTIIDAESLVEKEYIVKVRGNITSDKLEGLSDGSIELDGRTLKKAKVQRINETQLRFVLTEGKKRQIRRMCEIFDLEVTTLKRVRIGKIELGALPRGRWRLLAKNESVL